ASYPAAMTDFQSTTSGAFNGLRATTLETLKQGIDGVTTATPLQTVKDVYAAGMFQPLDFQEALMNLFTGNISGCIGETSAAAIIIGGLYMIYKRVIGFTIPVLYILTVFVLFYFFGGNTSLLSTESLVLPLYHILSGGLMLGAFFMATDMVTSPITIKGQVIFAAGCGILTFVIRKFGGYPEGVSYSILLMNLTVPLIDRYIRPVKYGRVKRDV
ncbi:MAG: RnfABCDGE type electron transport complex subunit D, partial [Chitinivibrionales bacterium]